MRLDRLTVALGLLALAGGAAQQTAPDEPGRSGLVERTSTRLTQIDVTVSGPAELIRALTAEDFKVRVDLKWIREFRVDGFCDEPPTAPEPGSTAALLAAGDPRRRPASYVLYFDQQQLTLTGRHRAMRLAKDLLPELIRNGNRAMVVSNARRLDTFSQFTDDLAALLDAIERLERDRTQWDFYANQESSRVEDVIDAFNRDGTVDRAVSLARIYQREERWRTEQSLHRLESVVARLASVEAPKALIYFADTTRANAGEHYLSFFSDRMIESDSVLAGIQSDATTAWLPFDRVVNLAAAQGVRFYSIQAEGLVSHFQTPLGLAAQALGARRSPTSRTRIRDAQGTLGSLSRETGGYAFINGATAPAIVDRMRSDFECLYLVSFDPAGISEDAPHALRVSVKRPGVRVKSRGRLIVESESARLENRLLGAFGAPEVADGPLVVHGELVPIGFDDGRYSALVQIAVPGIALQGSTWDLGASLVSRNRVQAEAQGRLTVSGPGLPVVLEREIRFPPGPYEVRSVAHETSTDLVASANTEVSWPDPNRGPACVGPFALLQPELAAFTRDGQVRMSGPLGVPAEQPVLTDEPTAFVGLVCRGRGGRGGALRVERWLRGASRVEFEPIELGAGGDRCAQVRDVVPAGALGPGSYSYEVRVLDGDYELASGGREFFAVDPS